MPEDVKLQRTQIPIASLVDDIDRRELRLPEIQRDYVWKPAQIAGLLDSLYREYPSGSILLWETQDAVEERAPKIEPTGALPAGRAVQYLLDGQQRLTSLHRVFHQPDVAKVVFNIATEKFQIESAATSKDVHWIRVYDVLHAQDLYTLIDDRARALADVDRPTVGRRLSRLAGIGNYVYHVEIISNLDYAEVTEIFIRVNSRGRALRTTDLALATLSARWPGVMTKLEAERDHWSEEGFTAFDLPFLARVLAATATESRTLSGFKETPTAALEYGWDSTKRGVRHLVKILNNNAGIETSTLLPSINALVPVATYLGVRPDEPLMPDRANALVYWLFAAFLTGRYNQSADTRIAEDARAVRGDDPIGALFANLGMLGDRIEVTEQALLGKGAGSPYFILSYLASKKVGATDWYWGVRIGLDATGAAALEYHHIHPQATLKKKYSKSEINDLANLAFISARANKKILNRSPSKYFPEIGDPELSRHFVPLATDLRNADEYPAFVGARRRLLAAAMNQFLESFRPSGLASSTAPEAPDRHLDVTIFRPEGGVAGVQFTAHLDETEWRGVIVLADLVRFLADIEDGHSASLPVGGEDQIVQPGAEAIEVPIGPFMVTGSLTEWRAMIERELEDVIEADPTEAVSPPWAAGRVAIPVVEAE